MSETFTRKTFEYFEGAVKNRKNLKWFEKNQEHYLEYVNRPFQILIKKCELALSDFFPGISFDLKVSRPLYRKNKIPLDGTIIKPNAYVFFAEKATSIYEMNPGIYFSVGAQENILASGLYMPSGRQLKLLRAWIMNHPESAQEIIRNKKLIKNWGGLAGEKYKRFPKEYDQAAPGAEYLWFKQFYVAQDLRRSDIIKKDFTKKLFADLKVTAPFLNNTRDIVGKYGPKRGMNIADILGPDD
jgi:uncharacterized protein (TIGR02453 family)